MLRDVSHQRPKDRWAGSTVSVQTLWHAHSRGRPSARRRSLVQASELPDLGSWRRGPPQRPAPEQCVREQCVPEQQCSEQQCSCAGDQRAPSVFVAPGSSSVAAGSLRAWLRQRGLRASLVASDVRGSALRRQSHRARRSAHAAHVGRLTPQFTSSGTSAERTRTGRGSETPSTRPKCIAGASRVFGTAHECPDCLVSHRCQPPVRPVGMGRGRRSIGVRRRDRGHDGDRAGGRRRRKSTAGVSACPVSAPQSTAAQTLAPAAAFFEPLRSAERLPRRSGRQPPDTVQSLAPPQWAKRAATCTLWVNPSSAPDVHLTPSRLRCSVPTRGR